MTRNAAHFSVFQPHTLLKHAIFREYFQRWGRILLLGGSSRKLVRVVDACAGRGRDSAGSPGSPLIAIREAAAAADQVSQIRGERVEIEVVAVEKRAGSFRALQSAVSEAATGHPVRLHHGTLADIMARLEKDFGEVPTFFFIDPFGMEALPADVIRRALRGRKNEVLLLYAGQAALRHAGAVQAGERVLDPEPTLFDQVADTQHLEQDETDTQRLEGAERSKRILDAAFDGFDWRSVIAQTRRGSERREALLALYRKSLEGLGASQILRIPILNTRAHLKYDLIHASHSPIAAGVMKEAAHSAWGKAEVGGSAVTLSREVVSGSAIRNGVNEIQRQFAGMEVPWQTPSRVVPSVRRYALEQTSLWPHNFDDLRKALKQYEFKRGHYKFPPV
ncbi:MAG TPA: three-Cys-motif partner protein TcmP [Longimicrobium sp.]